MKTNLESKRKYFFQFGLIVALSLSLLAFEWKTPTNYDVFDGQLANISEIEEIVLNTKDREKPKPKPKKPITTLLEIVEDDIEIKDEIIIDVETDEDEKMPEFEYTSNDIPDEDPVEEDIIFKVVEQQPEFPGGYSALLSFLGKNIKYPDMAREIGIQGVVYLGFVVEKNGKITDITLMRGIGGGCDEEAIRVLKTTPKWEPGRQRGKAVRVQYTLPVNFVLR